ncbi:TIGR03016 family PEP-CTERM system-associated outer membrane protein, partial [Aromatoleum evansii]|uniref:TIGR03016 family PEP-CTERM system-associated outer membrane protein n=1 Tax=Aromatoleum evansii TaxID=59406 RepID=UPI00145CBE1C
MRTRMLRPKLKPVVTAFCAGLAFAAISLPGVANAQSVEVRPFVSATVTYSDNVGADAQGGDGDLSLEVAPGVSVLRNSGRFRGNLNATVRNVAYMSETDRNDSFLTLNGHGQFEAVEKTLFIDMDASMSRNNRSAFFGRAAGDPQDISSDNETRMFGIGPRFNFRLGPETSGTASYMTRWMSGGGGLDNRRDSELNAQVSNPVQFGR